MAADSLSAGQIYRFRARAVNVYGSSEFSEELLAAIADFPAPNESLTRLSEESGESFITLQWEASLDTELPVPGYQVKMDDGYNGGVFEYLNQAMVLHPNVRKLRVSGLVTGLSYGF